MSTGQPTGEKHHEPQPLSHPRISDRKCLGFVDSGRIESHTFCRPSPHRTGYRLCLAQLKGKKWTKQKCLCYIQNRQQRTSTQGTGLPRDNSYCREGQAFWAAQKDWGTWHYSLKVLRARSASIYQLKLQDSGVQQGLVSQGCWACHWPLSCPNPLVWMNNNSIHKLCYSPSLTSKLILCLKYLSSSPINLS